MDAASSPLTIPVSGAATNANQTDAATWWPIWRRIVFRFLATYFLLRVEPWNWLGGLPLVGYLLQPINSLNFALVTWTNQKFFHVRDTLVLPNGSGDTSFAYAELQLYLWIALIVTIAWSIAGHKQRAYPRADYWLRTILRYYVATAAISYGIIKIFAMQMVFPSLSQLATPLGDLLPMRLSWLFIGYSTPYQMFSGFVEFVAGILLFYRRTVTVGLLLAAGAFANVVMINLAYDVPVKLYSSHLLVACVILLMYDASRLTRFFLFNRAAEANVDYEPYSVSRTHKYVRWALKTCMVWLMVLTPLFRTYGQFQTIPRTSTTPKPFGVALFDVTQYMVNSRPNSDTQAVAANDTLAWKDLVFDTGSSGSVGTADTLFWQRYHRGYFRFKADTSTHTMVFWRTSWLRDSTPLFDARYEMPDSNTLNLWTRIRGDSVYVEATRSNRHFQLAERQFHWLSEYNR